MVLRQPSSSVDQLRCLLGAQSSEKLVYVGGGPGVS